MFGIRKKPKGLLGNGGMFGHETPGYGDGVPMGQGPAAAPSPQPEQGGGFFKPGGGAQLALAGVSDFIDRRQGNRPTAIAGMLAGQQYAQQQAAALAAEQRKRSQGLQDYEAKAQIDAQYAEQKPTSLQQNYEWLKQNNPDEAENYLERMTNNYQYRQGADGRFYRMDIAKPPTKPVGTLRPVGTSQSGGPAQPAPGSFQR
jgi:hypothetical protein